MRKASAYASAFSGGPPTNVRTALRCNEFCVQ